MWRIQTLFALTLTVAPGSAHGWLRGPGVDYKVVKEAELIVVARLRPDTIRHFPYPPQKGNFGAAWEFRGTLIISEVLRGSGKPGELPIIIHYGLTPHVGGQFTDPRGTHDARQVYRMLHHSEPSSELIEIFDTGNSGQSFEPLVPDAGKNHLWFLRIYSRRDRPDSWPQQLGIAEPGDLQPLSLKEYFLAYLANDPEAAVREQLKKNPAIGIRALCYLQHVEIQRILADEDPYRRAEKLLPYYLADGTAGGEARDGLIGCGAASGLCLRAVFQEWTYYNRKRLDVMSIWGKTKDVGCVEPLLRILDTGDHHVECMMKQPDWDGSRPLKGADELICTEIGYAVYNLHLIGDPRAVPAIEGTRARWEKMQLDPGNIVESATMLCTI